MKTKKNLMLFVGLSSILALSACATQASTVTPEVPDEGQSKKLSDLSDAEMKALIEEKAHDQHTLEFVLSHDMTAEEWSTTLDRMIDYGAEINPEEKEAMIAWLVNR